MGNKSRRVYISVRLIQTNWSHGFIGIFSTFPHIKISDWFTASLKPRQGQCLLTFACSFLLPEAHTVTPTSMTNLCAYKCLISSKNIQSCTNKFYSQLLHKTSFCASTSYGQLLHPSSGNCNSVKIRAAYISLEGPILNHLKRFGPLWRKYFRSFRKIICRLISRKAETFGFV